MGDVTKEIYVRTHRKDFGPYSEQEFLRHLSGGRIPFSAWLYVDGQWQLLAENSKFREKHPQFEPKPSAGPEVHSSADIGKAAPTEATVVASAGDGAVSAEPIWFLIRDKKKFGPYSAADIVRQLQHKELDSTAFVWRPGFSTWQKLSTVNEFSRDAIRSLAEKGAAVDVIIKRKKPRAPYEVEVVAHDNTRAVEGKSMVIGEGGLFLSVARLAHAVGARLRLHFREGDTPSFNAVAEVVSIVRGEMPGYCLKFIALSDSDRKRIAKLVSERRTIS